ncbi:adhesion G-protein coupled receptor D1-like [Antedon mediterranea]|uniref:adhesion G-protein coupled receptor D1-like n=1 Tax=Antedon mediterranea TaxID=105859 RepID=UPI003AF9929C
MTYLCLGLSICVSIPTYISFMYIRTLRLNTRFIIVRNIVLSVCLRDLMFLFTDFVTSLASKPSYLCEVTGALLQYMSTCAFLWMLCASTDIWLKVHFPYFNHANNIYFYRSLSYISPMFIVCATIGGFRSGYVDENSCWLSITSQSMWVFYSTAIVLIVLISIELAMVACKTTQALKNSVQPANIASTKDPKQSRNMAKSFLPLLAVFGITWILGIFLVIGGTIIFDLLFVIVNGLQGFVLFLSQFLFSKQVHNAWTESKERATTRTL